MIAIQCAAVNSVAGGADRGGEELSDSPPRLLLRASAGPSVQCLDPGGDEVRPFGEVGLVWCMWDGVVE